jgi:hypothetical protein
VRIPLLLTAVATVLVAQAPPEDPQALEARIQKDQLVTADDYLAAARLMGARHTVAGFQAARELALVAWVLGQPNALVAQAEDGLLRALGLSARFAENGEGDSMPTDAHRLDFLMNPLTPTPESVEALQRKRLSSEWYKQVSRDKGANAMYQASQASRETALPASKRKALLKGYHEDRVRTPADLHQAARILTRSADASDRLLANEWAALALVRGDGPSRILFAQTWDRAAQTLGLPARYGTLGSQTMDPGVAPGVIRNLGFSGRPTSR